MNRAEAAGLMIWPCRSVRDTICARPDRMPWGPIFVPAATTQNRQLQDNRSAGDALSIAFELVATPALFAFFGWLIDGALGTQPVFTLALCLLTAVYAGWKAVRSYSDQMEAYDRDLPSRRAESAVENPDG